MAVANGFLYTQLIFNSDDNFRDANVFWVTRKTIPAARTPRTFYNLVFALLAYPIGILADKLGLKKIFIAGLFVFSMVYIGFAFNNNMVVFLLLFALYGLYAAATEGISKAWISNIVDKSETATAIGTYSGFQSIAALIASSLCGLLWFNFGSMFTFLLTAAVTFLVVIYLSFYKRTADVIQ